MAKKYILFFLFICASQFAQSQKIQILGNGNEIASDGSNIPSINNLTKYINVIPGSTEEHIFSIKNDEKKDKIEIVSISSNAVQFIVSHNLNELNKKEEGEFKVNFRPTSEGLIKAQITIIVRKKSEQKSYTFNVSGSDKDQADPTDLMITQYYENNKADFIEIKNLTANEINGNTYFLVHYKSQDKLRDAPKRGRHIEIRLQPNEVKVYEDFDLKGNDVVLISTRKDKNCFENRVDIIGTQEERWGEALSFSKGACASEAAHREFDRNNWIQLSLNEVDVSFPEQNIHKGIYQEGPVVWDGINWTVNNLPDRTRTVIIDGQYTTDRGDIEACDLIVNDELNFRGAVLGSTETSSVIVYGDLEINEQSGIFKLGDKMALVMYDDDANITGEIVKYERSTQLNNQYDFTYWSSSVTAASVGDVFSGVRPGRVYYFDQSRTTASDPDNDPEGTYWNVWVPASGTMKPGRGYASEASSDSGSRHLVSFQGQPNNGLIREQVHFNNDNDPENDWNLIGNPYPSAIDIEKFFDANSNTIDPAVYLWTHATPLSAETGDYSPNDYATYNYTGGTGVGNGPIPQKNIGSGQGFVVRAIKLGEVDFFNAMRLKNENDQFFKNAKSKKVDQENSKDRIWLNLTTNQGGFNQLLIGFMEGATDGFDNGYDAVKLEGSNKISFYSVLEKEKLAIQGLGPFAKDKEVSLGFETRVSDRTLTIGIDSMEGELLDADIILYDNKLDITHNLGKSDYTFDQFTEVIDDNRFTLKFQTAQVVEEADIPGEGQFQFQDHGDRFRISATKKIKTMHLYDIQGRLIRRQHPDQNSFEFTESYFKSGEIIILQIINEDQSKVTKKYFKH